MVELALNFLDENLVPHCYVSMRVGESQKIGRLSAERMYKFPESVVGEHKYAMLDVFQRIGGCTLSIKPKVFDQDVNLNTKAGQLRFRVSETPASETHAKSPPTAETLQIPKKLEAAKTYLAKHNLELRLKEAMQHVINEMPDDPVEFIYDRMRESEGIVLRDDVASPLSNNGKTMQQDSGSYKVEARTKVVDHEVLASISELRKEIAERKKNQAKLAAQVSEATKAVQSLTQKEVDSPKQQDVQSRSARKRLDAGSLEEVYQISLRKEEFKEDLTEDQIKQIAEAFSRFDRGGDATIPKYQLGDLMRALGEHPTEEEVQDILVDDVDIDDTGKITFPEILSVMARRARDTEAERELVDAFKPFDHDRSGYIKTATLRSVLSKIGESFTDQEIDTMIKDNKLSKDGLIDYAGFAKVMVSTDFRGEL